MMNYKYNANKLKSNTRLVPFSFLGFYFTQPANPWYFIR